jgi:hypothetical protein
MIDLIYKENFIMQFRLLDNKARPKWEISRWTYSPEKKRAIKENLEGFSNPPTAGKRNPEPPQD